MKWEAGTHPSVRVLAELVCPGEVAGVGRDASQRVEGEHLDRRVVPASRVLEDGDQPFFGVLDPIRGVHRGKEAITERDLLAAPGGAVPRRAASSMARARCVCPSARRTRPRCTRPSAASRTSPMASAFSSASSNVAAPVS